MATKDNLEETRKLIDKLTKEKREVIIRGEDIEFNRKVLENKKVQILVLNHKIGRDKLKERDSGLNEILCRIARENNITLAIDLNDLKTENKLEKGKILGRIIQNIKLIRKNKNKIVLVNKPNDKRNLQALLLVLGMDTKSANEISKN